MKLKYCLLAVLLLFLKLSAQQPSIAKALSIGDVVPPVKCMHVTNYVSSSINLSSFKNKLVILDFWSTWCSACLHVFPHLDSLQQQFKTGTQIILLNTKTAISGDNEFKIKKTLQRLKVQTGKAISLPVIYSCPQLDNYFPCTIIPQEVWIKNGRVVAVTSATELTAANIQSILAGKSIMFHQKKDVLNYNTNEPLLVNNNGAAGNEIMYRTLITGYIEGIGGSSGFRLKNNQIVGSYVLNSSLFSLTKEAYNNEITLPDNRIIIESADKNFRVAYNDTTVYSHTYCYDLITPPADETTIRNYMQNDLKKYFNISLHTEVRKIKCLVLKKDSTKSFVVAPGTPAVDVEEQTANKFIYGYPPASVIKLLNRYSTLPLIDETGISVGININLPFNINNVTALQNAFQNCGLLLTEEERPLQVVIISNL